MDFLRLAANTIWNISNKVTSIIKYITLYLLINNRSASVSINQMKAYLSNSNLSCQKRCSFSSQAFLSSNTTSISSTLQIKIDQALPFSGFIITVYTYPVG
jgi:hypothetical protein